MTLLAEEHVHQWLPFGAGRGCATCEAWEFWHTAEARVDALPTSLLQQPRKPDYVASVPTDDLGLDVMNDLLEVAREDVNWMELEALASRIILRVRATLAD